MRGLAIGALAGFAWVLADALGAALAVGALFQPSAEGFLLLGVAFACGVAAAALLGAVVALVWRAGWWRPSRRLVARASPVLFAAVVLVGFAARTGRNLAELPPRPSVAAARPVPV